MKSLRLPAKLGVVFLGWAAAFAVAWIAVAIRQAATQGPEAQASSGMYAAGDAMLGVMVFGVLALIPLALALYWLRPVAQFWSTFTTAALIFGASGVIAIGTNMVVTFSHAGWPLLLSTLRIGIMPLTALAFLVCAPFAPQVKHRWVLFAVAMSDGTIIVSVILVKFILPNFGR